jgi:hypothetical protein
MEELASIEKTRLTVGKRIQNYQKVLTSLQPIDEVRNFSLNVKQNESDTSPVMSYRPVNPNQSAYTI